MLSLIIILTSIIAVSAAVILSVQSSLEGTASSRSQIGKESVRSSFGQLRDLYLESRDNPTAVCNGGTDYNACPQLYSVYVPTNNTAGYLTGSGISNAIVAGSPVCQNAQGAQLPQNGGGGCPTGYTLTTPAVQSYPTTYGEEVAVEATAKPVCRYIAQCESQQVYNGFTQPGLLFASSTVSTKPEYCKLRVTYTRMLEGECEPSISAAPSQAEICATGANTTNPDRTSTIVAGPNAPQYKYCASEYNVYQVERRVVTSNVLGVVSRSPYALFASTPAEFNNVTSCNNYLAANSFSTNNQTAVGAAQYRCVVTMQRCNSYTATWTNNPRTGATPQCAAQSSLVGGIVPLVDAVTGTLNTIIAGAADPSTLSNPNQPNPNLPGEYQAINYLDPNKLLARVTNSLAAAGELPRPIGFDWTRDASGAIQYIVPITDTSIDAAGFRDVYVCMKANSATGSQSSNTASSVKALIEGMEEINSSYETMDQNCNVAGACKARLVMKSADGSCDPTNRSWTPADGVSNASLVWNLGQIKPKRECTNGTEMTQANADGTCPATHATKITWKSRVIP